MTKLELLRLEFHCWHTANMKQFSTWILSLRDSSSIEGDLKKKEEEEKEEGDDLMKKKKTAQRRRRRPEEKVELKKKGRRR